MADHTQIPPHNTTAEQTVLGTFFLDERTLAEVQSLIGPDDFYDPRNQEIFRVLLDMVEDNKPIDLMLLTSEMERRGILQKVGGPAYLAGLEQFVLSPANVGHHAKLVREKSLLRQILSLTGEVADDTMHERHSSEDLLGDFEQKISKILVGTSQYEFRSIAEDTLEVYRNLERRSDNRQEVTGLSTGIPTLDLLTGGFQPSDLIVLAARPSVGKTSLALNIAAAAAKSVHRGDDDARVRPGIGIFSMEMNREQVIQRMVCTEAQIKIDLLRKNMLSEAEILKFSNALEDLRQYQIYINDAPTLTATDLRIHSQRLQNRCPNLALIVVDYLQLMGGQRARGESRQQEVSDISRSLKAIARDLKIPVLALSQLSREIESRRGKDAKPRLSDLRESGAIEQDADVVMFIHRKEARDTDKDDDEDDQVSLVNIIVAKQRNGPIGTVQVLFREDFTQFVPLAPGQEV